MGSMNTDPQKTGENRQCVPKPLQQKTSGETGYSTIDALKADSGSSSYKLAVRYLVVLCLLFAAGNIFLTIHSVQLNSSFQSWSVSQREQVSVLSRKFNTLNLTYSSLFIKFPELNKYCPITNKTSNERTCRHCPEGWVSFGEKCYLYSSDRQDWKTSQCHCMSVGGQLVVIRSEEEQVYLWKKAKALTQGDSYWIGLHDSSNGDWQWVDNTSMAQSVQFWGYLGQRGDSGELCAQLSPGDNYKMDWYSVVCKSGLKRICERRSGSLL
ncbi:hypothetical protein JZ751_000203 [Albula glossodonta]|uniref:C-type lectin domain-containing protein n=1 Tax=Albula glossodonta TaxID=121402 RepID=A0A8T2PVK9_9TELE|nr:hypothetical protein JZ751_000203 [Albula glossodonta]